MTPGDRAERIVPWSWHPSVGRAQAVIAAAIEECRLHAPVLTRPGIEECGFCVDSNPDGHCLTYARLSAPLLAAGVPEHELRGEEAADG